MGGEFLRVRIWTPEGAGEAAARVPGSMGYRIFLQSYGGVSWYAFHTVGGLRAFLRAYRVTLRDWRKCGLGGYTCHAVPSGDLARWEGLHVRNYSEREGARQ